MLPRHADLTGQTFALKDDKREPLVIHFHVTFEEGVQFEREQLLNTTQRIFALLPDYFDFFELSPSGISRRSPLKADMPVLAEAAWENDSLTTQEFQSLTVDWRQAPLFRFRYRPSEGLYLAIHHSLVDGKSAMLFLQTFLSLLAGTEPPPTELFKSKTIVTRRPSKWVTAFDLISRALTRQIWPTLIGSNPERRFGTEHWVFEKTLAQEQIQSAISQWRDSIPDLKATEYFIACYAQALDQTLRKSNQSERVRINMPVCMRRYADTTSLAINWASFVSVTAPGPVSNGDFAHYLREIQKRSKRIKTLALEWTMIRVLDLASALGLFKKAYKTRHETGLSQRALQPHSKSWKSLDTAVLSSALTPLPEALLPFIKAIYPYPPVFPPTCFGMGIATSQKGIHIAMNVSNASVKRSEAEQVWQKFLTNLESLPS